MRRREKERLERERGQRLGEKNGKRKTRESEEKDWVNHLDLMEREKSF